MNNNSSASKMNDQSMDSDIKVTQKIDFIAWCVDLLWRCPNMFDYLRYANNQFIFDYNCI